MRYCLCTLGIAAFALGIGPRARSAPVPDKQPPASPLIRALLANDVGTAKALIEKGADPNARDSQGSSALMDAIGIRQKDLARALLARGARVNDKDRAGMTAINLASFLKEPEIVRMLLERKADPNIRTSRGDSTAVTSAASAGSVEILSALLAHGGDINATGRRNDSLLLTALRKGNMPMVDFLLDRHADANSVNKDGETPLMLAAAMGKSELVIRLLSAGANARAVDLDGRTPLMFAAMVGSERCLRSLIESGVNVLAKDSSGRSALMAVRGADPGACIEAFKSKGLDLNARDKFGCTALIQAAKRGDLPSVKALLQQGADAAIKDARGRTALARARALGNTAIVKELGEKDSGGDSADAARTALLRETVRNSVRLLESSATRFRENVGGTCFSCHNQSMPQYALRAAADRGFAVDRSLVAKDTAAVHNEYVRCAPTVKEAVSKRRRIADGPFGARFPGGASHVGYGILGLAAWDVKPDQATETVVRYLALMQDKDGHWQTNCDVRAPAEKSNFTETALAIFSLRSHVSPKVRPEVENAVTSGRAWLIKTPPSTTEDKTFQLFGLAWSGLRSDSAEVQKSAQALLKEQREDGGWSQEAGMQSDAYATGEVLVALHRAGGLAVTDPVYRAGAAFLLRTVEEDGSWYVRSRTVPFQGYIETGYPYRQDQFISINAASWATVALAETLPRKSAVAARQ